MPRIDSDGVIIYETNPAGYIVFCSTTSGIRPTTAGKFAIGCKMLAADGKEYFNTGTIAVPVWNSESEVSTAEIADGAITAVKFNSVLTSAKEFYVDGSRTDTYTETGSYYTPYKKISTCITALNALAVAQLAIGVPEYAANTRYVVNVATGTYSDNIAITNIKYLRINLNGASITGNITYDTTMVGGTADQYYSKLEFFGGYGTRADKGNSGRITGTITSTRNNDSLCYISFTGIDLTNTIAFATNGTWVLSYHNCHQSGRMTTADSAIVLIETTGWNEFTGHLANAADAVAAISLYNADNAEFDLINIDNSVGSRITNCRFGSAVTVTGGNLYLDNNSYKSLLAQTETLTGATVILLDDYLPAAAAQEEIAAGTGGAINITSALTFISTDAGGDTFTLANGTHIRHRKKIIFRTDGGGDAVVTGSFAGTANTLTFSDAGEYALLEWNGTDWIALELGSVLDVTNAPALTTV